MQRISSDIAEHSLNIKPGSSPIKLGLRCFNQEKRRAMGEVLPRILATVFVREI
jgi:hypothetical protein